MDNFCSLDSSHLEKDSKYEKTVHKRRSSVFQSRAIIFDESKGTQFGENEKATETIDTRDTVECASKILQGETFNLEEYILNLKNERKEWIETLKQRRMQRKNYAKEKLYLESQGQLLDLNVLSKCEKTFVIAKPNYEHICNNYKKLSDIIVKVSVLHNLVYKLNQNFVLQMERRLHKVNDKIMKTSRS